MTVVSVGVTGLTIGVIRTGVSFKGLFSINNLRSESHADDGQFLKCKRKYISWPNVGDSHNAFP